MFGYPVRPPIREGRKSGGQIHPEYAAFDAALAIDPHHAASLKEKRNSRARSSPVPRPPPARSVVARGIRIERFAASPARVVPVGPQRRRGLRFLIARSAATPLRNRPRQRRRVHRDPRPRSGLRARGRNLHWIRDGANHKNAHLYRATVEHRSSHDDSMTVNAEGGTRENLSRLR